MDEREQIVKWLLSGRASKRVKGTYITHDDRNEQVVNETWHARPMSFRELAAAIRRGEHLDGTHSLHND